MEDADNQDGGEQGTPVRQSTYGVVEHNCAMASLPKTA